MRISPEPRMDRRVPRWPRGAADRGRVVRDRRADARTSTPSTASTSWRSPHVLAELSSTIDAAARPTHASADDARPRRARRERRPSARSGARSSSRPSSARRRCSACSPSAFHCCVYARLLRALRERSGALRAQHAPSCRPRSDDRTCRTGASSPNGCRTRSPTRGASAAHVGVLFIDINGCARSASCTASTRPTRCSSRSRAGSAPVARRRPVRAARRHGIRAGDAERARCARDRAARAAAARPAERAGAAAARRYADRRVDRHRVLPGRRRRLGRRDGRGQRRDVRGAARRQESRRVQRAGRLSRSDASMPPRDRARRRCRRRRRAKQSSGATSHAAQPRELPLRELARRGDAALAQRVARRYAPSRYSQRLAVTDAAHRRQVRRQRVARAQLRALRRPARRRASRRSAARSRACSAARSAGTSAIDDRRDRRGGGVRARPAAPTAAARVSACTSSARWMRCASVGAGARRVAGSTRASSACSAGQPSPRRARVERRAHVGVGLRQRGQALASAP